MARCLIYLFMRFICQCSFFVTGFLYLRRREGSIGKIVLKKAKTLLIPYFVLGLFHCILYGLVFGFSKDHYYHLCWINTEGIPISGALWFLTALFFTDVLYLIIDRFRLHFLIIPLAIFGCFAEAYFNLQLPWALNAPLVGMGFYWCGDLYKKICDRKIISILFRRYYVTVVCVVTVLLILFNGYVNMRTGKYANVLLFWINALLSIMIILSASEFLSEKVHLEILLSIGRNSIIYLGFNQLVITVIRRILDRFTIPIVLERCILLLFSMTLLYILSILFTRTKLRICFGKVNKPGYVILEFFE